MSAIYIDDDADQSVSVELGKMFKTFMKEALADSTATTFRIPPGIRLVRVNATTGRLARSSDKKIILEAFKPGTIPIGEAQILRGEAFVGPVPAAGTGGLY